MLTTDTFLASIFTEHTNDCRGCGKRFRIPQDGWDMARADEPTIPDAELALMFDFCGRCCFGEDVPGEYDAWKPGDSAWWVRAGYPATRATVDRVLEHNGLVVLRIDVWDETRKVWRKLQRHAEPESLRTR